MKTLRGDLLKGKRLDTGAGLALFVSIFIFIGYPIPAYPLVSGQEGPGGASYAGVTEPVPEEGEILVKFKKNVKVYEKRGFHALADAKVLSVISELGVEKIRSNKGESAEALLKRYSQSPLVEYAEPNGIVQIQLTPNDTRFSELYGLHNTGQSGGTSDADIDAPEAWDSQRVAAVLS